MILTRVAAPSVLPIDLAEAKAHLRVISGSEDQAIEAFLAAAFEELDGPAGVLGRCLAAQTWQLQLAGWHGPVRVPVEPVTSIGVSYVSAAGGTFDLPAASFELAAGIGVSPVLYWKGPLPELGAETWPVRVTLLAGAVPLPATIRAAILMRVADLYAHREAHGASLAANPAYDQLIAQARRHY